MLVGCQDFMQSIIFLQIHYFYWRFLFAIFIILKILAGVCEFHITSHLLCWACGGGATNSLSLVLYMGISYSHYHVDRALNSTQSIHNGTKDIL